MKKTLVSIAAMGLMALGGLAWAGDAAEMAEACLDCHEMDEFEGMSADELMAATKEGNANSKMMAKAAADLSEADLKAIVDYLAAEANK
jgi:cytochrome c553